MQHFRDVRVGDQVRLDPSRGMEAAPTLSKATWFALLTPPQKERAARAYLRAHDITAFYPSEERKSTVRGKMKSREAPIVPGYVYAKFYRTPQWDVIRTRPFFTGVVSLGIRPFPIPRAIVRRLQGLTVEAEELARAKRETWEAVKRALAPKEGDRATIEEGPLTGFLVDVTSIRGGMANILLPGGVKGQAHVTTLRREGVDLTEIPGYVPE